MTTILNNTSLLNAPRPIDTLGNPQTKVLGNVATDAHKASAADGIAFANADAATVHPKLYDALQSIIVESRGIQSDAAAALSNQIKDVKSADGIIGLAKTQILNQSGRSALGQNSKDAQAVLSLLK